jgi:hypothetical protein
MDEAQDILKTQFQKLPKNLQDAITSVSLQEKLKKVVKKFMLHIDQAGALENETVLVMLGLESSDDYRENIRRALNIADGRAEMIANNINQEIFLQIRETLKEISQTSENTGENSLDNKKEQLEKEEEKSEKTNHSPITPPVPQAQAGEASQGAPPPNLPTEKPLNVTNDIVKDKLENQVRIPREEIDLNNDNSEQQEKKRPYSSDPYREPVE